MRVLRFIVNKQIIERDPNCDFDNLVPGTEGYLQASFSFSPDWDDCVKAAGFYSMLGNEFPPVVLKDGKTCMIPTEALKKKKFKIQVVGVNGVDKRLTTNKVTVVQNGG
jgi:hypothetical protein